MKDFYIIAIAKKKKGNMEIYNNLLQDTFGVVLSWKEVQELDRYEQMRLMIELSNLIKLKESKLDIEKLTKAIQFSRSGVGFCVMTEFVCVFCGEKETWGNSATPNICGCCAEKMAENIILNGMDIEKD